MPYKLIENEMRIFCRDISDVDSRANEVVKNLSELVKMALARDYAYTGVMKSYNVDNSKYDEKNDICKRALLAFCGEQSGVTNFRNKEDLAKAFSVTHFREMWNAIVVETLMGIMTNVNSPQIMALANIEEVPLGSSKTFEIEPKRIPIAQRTSYNTNVTLMNGFSKSAITVTPKPYTLGSSIDYIRVLGNGFDFGKEIARVALGIIYAQLALVVGIVFDTANVTGTPLYQGSWDPAKFVLMIQYLQALNKTSVKAWGTLPAFNTIGVLATHHYGFQTQDEMLRQGYLNTSYGINNMLIEQATDLSAPFIDANLSDLLLVPNDIILLLSDVGDKPAKMARESFIRVISKDPNDSSLYTLDYSYTMSFDVGLCSQAHYAIQSV